MTWRRLVWVVVALFLSNGVAQADGAFAKSARYTKELAEPDQKALLFQDQGRETLLLQVTYRGQAEEFGWVVPVPARPKLSAASSDVFLELVRLTSPELLPPKGMKARGGGGGVSVVERAQVGPYDATVLAASDANALARWLKQHGYTFPAGSAQVLAPYVQRRWYYVALRVRVKKDLLARFRQVDPTLDTLQQAPTRVAARVMSLSDTHPQACAAALQLVDRAWQWATDHPADPSGTAQGGELGQEYRSYRSELARLRRGSVQGWEAQEMRSCLQRCAGGPTSQAFQAAATRARWTLHGKPAEVAAAFYAAVQRDLWKGVPYARSHAGRLHAALRAAKQGPKEMFYYFQTSYESARLHLPQLRHLRGDPASLPNRYHGPALTHTSLPVRRALNVMERKAHLHARVQYLIAQAENAADAALRSGTIAPLRLEFASTKLIYPLRISSLNPGQTKLQLYVLAPHRMTAAGFTTEYATRVDGLKRSVWRHLPHYLGGGHDYLTRLGATLSSKDMTRDVVFSRADTDAVVHPGPRVYQPTPPPHQPNAYRRSGTSRRRR